MADDRYIERNWPERYNLDRLSDAERLEFEAHMVQCERCYREVRLSERYIDGISAMRDDPALEDTGGRLTNWPTWALAAAALVLVAVALTLVMRSTGRSDEALLASLHESGRWQYTALAPAGAILRGDDAPAQDAPTAKPDREGRLPLFFDIPMDRGEGSFILRVTSRAGEIVAGPLTIYLVHESSGLRGAVWHTDDIPPGRYRLEVIDDTGAEAGSAWLALDR